ncbi:MAG: SGNH/GDSL hydrolase family protein [Gemmatimonadales bacterium]|nr:SGNH/GDSL hydrolase family protein [Gemmatimonadales bacterium]
MLRRFPSLALLAVAALLAGCAEDQTVPTDARPDLSNNDGIFRRFVAIGTSISAGLQSGGINDSTQRLAFPVLVARQANADFAYPSLRMPGCPPPLASNTTGIRVSGDTAGGCALRNPPPPYLNNIAVPGLSMPDMFTNTGSPLTTYERLQFFFLGGKVPVRAIMDARPTLITVELGSNDVLGAVANSADPGAIDSITPPDVFDRLYEQLADSLDRTGSRVVLVTVPDVTQVPFASQGLIYWCLKNGCPAPINIPANPVFQAAVLFTVYGAALVPWTIGLANALRSTRPPFPAFTLDCTNTLQVATPAELAYAQQARIAYNVTINRIAAERGYAVLDANAILAQLKAGGAIPPFPIVDPAALAAGGSVGFGPWFSLDGFHPSSAANRLFADSTISAINRAFGTRLEFVGP